MGDLEWSPASGVKSQQAHLGCYCSYTWGFHRKENCQKYEKFSYCMVLLKPNSSRKIKFISGDNTAMFRKGFLLQHKLIIYLKLKSLLEKMHFFLLLLFSMDIKWPVMRRLGAKGLLGYMASQLTVLKKGKLRPVPKNHVISTTLCCVSALIS